MPDEPIIRYATHDEFNAFRSEVKKDIHELRLDLKHSLNNIYEKISELTIHENQVNWKAVSVGLVMISMSAGLVWTLLQGESAARQVSITHREQMAAIRQKYVEEILTVQVKRLDARINALEFDHHQYEKSLTSLERATIRGIGGKAKD